MQQSVLAVVVAVLVCVGLALALHFVARIYTRPGGFRSETATLLGSLISVYGILASLVVVTAWSQYRAARDQTQDEVSDAVNLYRTLSHMPAPLSATGPRAVIDYLDSLVTDEWPEMRNGRLSRETTAALDNLWFQVATYEPKQERHKLIMRYSIQQLIELGDDRHQRLAISARVLPTEMWAMVLIGALLALGLSPLLGVRNRRALILRLGAAVMIGLIIAAIYAFARPFVPPATVPVKDIQIARDNLRKDWEARHLTAAEQPGTGAADGQY